MNVWGWWRDAIAAAVISAALVGWAVGWGVSVTPKPVQATAAEPRAEDVLPRRMPPDGPGTLADLVEEGRRSEGGV